MNFHTHYLNVLLILAAISYPASLIPILIRLNIQKISALLPNVLIYLILVILCYETGYVKSIYFNVSFYFYFIALLVSVVCIYFEIFEAKFAHFIKYKSWPKRIIIHESMKSKCIILDIVLIALGAIGEEIIFRQVFFYITYDILGISIYAVMAFSSLLYGINHIYFGTNAVLQKLITGFIYSLLFIFSGYFIVVPIIAHFSQNMILYIWALRNNKVAFIRREIKC